MTIVAAVIIAALIAGSVYALVKANEEAKAAREKERRRMLEAAHRTPRPFSERAAQGFDRNRRGNDAA